MKTLKIILLCFIWSVLTVPVFGQIVEESGTLEQFVNNLIDEMPDEDSNEFQLPSESEVSSWNTFFSEMVKENFEMASSLSEAIGYEVVKFTDTENSIIYYIARKSSQSSNWWGTYFFNPQAKRSDLVFEAPHAIKDFNTGKQSALAFKKMSAWSLSITGTHRCNNTELSSCDGTTQVCSGGNTSFRISDMAHTIDGIMYLSAILLDNERQNLVKHIQLHGFGRDEGDPAFILSNGVTDQPSGGDILQDFSDNLLKVDASYTSELAHKNPDIKLKGTSNTIGRWINNSAEPCNTSASSNSGRFFHFEQAKEGIRDSEQNWLKVIEALEMTFPKDVVSSIKKNPLEVDVRIFSDPSKSEISFSYHMGVPMKFKRSIIDLSGKVISHKVFDIKMTKNYTETLHDPFPPGIYILMLESENEIKNTKFIRK